MFIPSNFVVVNLSIMGTLASFLFIAFAIGPDLSLIIPLMIPLLCAVTLQFSRIQASFWIVFMNAGLFFAFQSHTAWGIPIKAAHRMEIFLCFVISLIMGALFFLLKWQDNHIKELISSLERLDQAYQKVVDANLDFQTYALFAREEAMEKERRRLAGELHDIIGYSLTNVIMLIQAAQLGKGDSEQTHAILEKARLHADESLREARQALAILRSEPSDRPRGANLFLKLTKTFQEVTGIPIRVDFANLPAILPSDIEKIIYRLIQEGLTNAFKHGKATEVFISFWVAEGNITVRIRDNGQGDTSTYSQGIEPTNKRTGIGLAGLREEVEQRGGCFNAGPVPGGFLLEATIPIQKDNKGLQYERKTNPNFIGR
ncbi:MAG: sensor histidine kinase [Breznakiellaceae bacterium]